MYLTGDRLKHSIAVKDKMITMLPKYLETFKEIFNISALYHDIGYSDLVNPITGNHNIDGYYYIRNKTSPIVAYMVLMHSNSEDFFKELGDTEEFEKAKRVSWFLLSAHCSASVRININIILNILNYCDLTTDSIGNDVTLKERLDDIGYRYGIKSIQYISILNEIDRLTLLEREGYFSISH